jgi:hypothetical protein
LLGPGQHPVLRGERAAYAAGEATAELREGEDRIWQCDLARDLFPREPGKIKRAWLSVNEGAVLRLAQTIHAEGAFDQVPVLGDALEEAGCTDKVILSHCRSSGLHTRGCWVVDLVLGEK